MSVGACALSEVWWVIESRPRSDGHVTRKEFRRAMGLLSFEGPGEAVDALFDEVDKDRSGKIE